MLQFTVNNFSIYLNFAIKKVAERQIVGVIAKESINQSNIGKPYKIIIALPPSKKKKSEMHG
jgi:hypothetical protein